MTPDLSRRIHRPEKMDDPLVDGDKMRRALRELAVVNRGLGGWRTSVDGVRSVLPRRRTRFTLLDVGTGGGDVAAVLHDRLRRSGYRPHVVGIDRSPDAIEHARSAYGSRKGLRFIRKDVHDLPDRHWDVVHASLFLHHFPSQEIPSLLRNLFRISNRGLVINDLHRHRFALYAIRGVTSLFSRSELVRHDAPLSVRRGFTREELEEFGRKGDLPSARIQWNWAFRWRVTFCR